MKTTITLLFIALFITACTLPAQTIAQKKYVPLTKNPSPTTLAPLPTTNISHNTLPTNMTQIRDYWERNMTNKTGMYNIICEAEKENGRIVYRCNTIDNSDGERKAW